MKKTRRIHKFLIFIIFIAFFILNNKVKASNIDPNFPNSYKIYLNKLSTMHPNWIFQAKSIGITLDEAVNNESVYNKNQINYGNGWVNASKDKIEEMMNPLNFLNESQIFQFEDLNLQNFQNIAGINSILYGTYMSNTNGETIPVQYYSNGNYYSMNKTYAQAIYDAGKAYGISPYHLAARIRLETGCDIYGKDYIQSVESNSPSLKGTLAICGNYDDIYRKLFLSEPVENLTGYYNFYNIGGNNYKNMGTIAGMLKYAKTPAKGNETSYGEPWNDPIKAIEGGGKFLYLNYISKNQNTLYFEKFNVGNDNKYGNQYQQNVDAAHDEAAFVYKAYKQGVINNNIKFIIPVYKDLEETSNADNFSSDNTMMKIDGNVNGIIYNVNVRSTIPDSDGNLASIVANAVNGEYVKRIAISNDENINWSKIRLSDGTEGYVINSALADLSAHVSSINLDKNSVDILLNSSMKLNYSILPDNAEYKNVIWSSSNNDIATVSDDGIVYAKASGTAKITVTALDKDVTATCDVTVKANSTEIQLDSLEYAVQKNNYLDIKPKIIPNDNGYTFTIKDSNIAIIENNKIKGINNGTTEVTIKANDSDASVTFKLYVLNSEADEFLNFDKSLSVGKNYNIDNINPNTKISDFKKFISTNMAYTIKDISNNVISNDSCIGTGSCIETKSINGEIKDYIVIIYGDLNGDGQISVSDLLLMKRNLTKKIQLNKYASIAASISNHDGNANVTDLLRLKRHLTKKEFIKQ